MAVTESSLSGPCRLPLYSTNLSVVSRLLPLATIDKVLAILSSLNTLLQSSLLSCLPGALGCMCIITSCTRIFRDARDARPGGLRAYPAFRAEMIQEATRDGSVAEIFAMVSDLDLAFFLLEPASQDREQGPVRCFALNPVGINVQVAIQVNVTDAPRTSRVRDDLL